MQSLRQGFWNYQIDAGRRFPVLASAEEADVLIIGGGLSGMWAACDIKSMSPDSRVVLLERDYLGFGPSGRSGGIVYDFWLALPRLSRLLNPQSARRLARFSEECVRDIQNLPDIDWRQSGVLHISTNSAHDDRSEATKRSLRAAGRDDLWRELSPEETSQKIQGPRWRGSTFYPQVATVHPAKLVRSLSAKLEDLGVRIFEGSEALQLDRVSGAWLARTPGGTVRAPLVLQATGAVGSMAVRGVIASSSHMVVSEPLDDLEEYWPSPVAATDERSAVRYFRKWGNRVAFGWGFGRADWGQDLRLGDAGSARMVARVFREFFPHWADRRLEFSWGGPVDISPTHLPRVRETAPGLWQVGGYTGNGIGPTRTLGRILAKRLLGFEEEYLLPEPTFFLSSPAILEPLGNLTRSALLRCEAAEERGERPKLVPRVLRDLPGRFGVELGR